MLRAIAAAKKKNDRIDTGKIADCRRCDFLPGCHMASRDSGSTSNPALQAPAGAPDGADEEPDLRSNLVMETEVSHNKRRLHKVGYFRELLASNEEVNESIRPLPQGSRDTSYDCRKRNAPRSVRCSEMLCWPNASNASRRFVEWARSQR
jgi:transposase